MSLRKDEEKKRLEQEKIKKIEANKAAIEAKITEKKENIVLLKKNMKDEPEEGAFNVSKISIRLPSGDRIIRRFNSTDKVKVGSYL